MNILSLKSLLSLLCLFIHTTTLAQSEPVKDSLTIGLLLNTCEENSTAITNTYKNAAIWTVQRLNYLETTPFTLSAKIYTPCTKKDVFNSMFDAFKRENNSFALGIISVEDFPSKASKVCDAFHVNCLTRGSYVDEVVKAAVSFLESFTIDRFLTVIGPNDDVLDEFNTLARLKGICVGRSLILGKKNIQLKHIHGRTVLFGTRKQINYFLNTQYKEAKLENPQFIFVSLDGLPLKEVPDGSYVISAVHLEDSNKYEMGSKLIPTTLLFEVASPILQITTNISSLISLNCNNPASKVDCYHELHDQLPIPQYKHINPFEILSQLKIETLMKLFIYNIYKVENLTITLKNGVNQTSDLQNWIVIGNYSIFEQSTNLIDVPIEQKSNQTSSINCSTTSIEECFANCVNFDLENRVYPERIGIWLRPDAWVYAFLAIAALGCILCFSILIFLFVRICKKDIFEGNPTLTILLLLLVICMYASVVPFAIKADSSYQEIICLGKSLSVSLVYASTFALLLSRCILLSTISKEVGFMAHASGPIQIFLGLFMLAVQVALDLRLMDSCSETMRTRCFICILSYNLILLFLLICTTFFIISSERNYREGKYLGIAILLITCIWSIWVPLYYIYKDYEDPILCFGLVGTASSLLGAVFIPRTYVMTISVARDKFTSALPALASAVSAMDIYRANTQPIYDCINVAAINATNTGTNTNNLQHPDFYTHPDLNEEFTNKSDTPVGSDKLTRF